MIEHVGHQAEALLDEIPARHADLKPENILIFTPNPESPYEWSCKIADFGITSFQEAKGVSNEGMHVFGFVFGSKLKFSDR
jgi:serine/threonine protein kinase